MEGNITGVMVYYDLVCKRKLWYFIHEIRMEQDNENVKLGKLLDDSSYTREEKHINIDDTINIDFIRARGVIHEVKKSRKIEEAAIWQVKYYLYFLKQRGVEGITGKIDYPLLKQTVTVQLEEDDEMKMQEILEEIRSIEELPLPPDLVRKKICKSCAYYDLCFI